MHLGSVNVVLFTLRYLRSFVLNDVRVYQLNH